MLNTFGQMLSVAASFLFPASTAPGWTLGCVINLSASLTAGTLAGLLSTYYAHHRRHYTSATGAIKLTSENVTHTHSFWDWLEQGVSLTFCFFLCLIFLIQALNIFHRISHI